MKTTKCSDCTDNRINNFEGLGIWDAPNWLWKEEIDMCFSYTNGYMLPLIGLTFGSTHRFDRSTTEKCGNVYAKIVGGGSMQWKVRQCGH